MTEAICQVETCDRPVRDATVCGACCGQLERALGDIPALADELDTTLARQTAIGDRNGKARSAVKPLPYDPRASEALWVLRNTLVGWVRELSGDGVQGAEDSAQRRAEAFPADTVADMARWLLARADELRVHPAGGEAVDEITVVVRDVRRIIDRPAGRWFLAACDNCGTDLYAKARATWTSCQVCGTEYDVTERKDWMRDRIEDQLYHSVAMSDVLKGVGVHVPDATIRSYAKRGRLMVKTYDDKDRPLYRVGDVLALVRSLAA